MEAKKVFGNANIVMMIHAALIMMHQCLVKKVRKDYYNYYVTCISILTADSVEKIQYSNCSNYETRLSGNSNPLSGKVEMCYNNAWFGICRNDFYSSTSTVICQSMGYSLGNKSKYILVYFTNINVLLIYFITYNPTD